MSTIPNELPPELTSPSRALEARNAYQEELMAQAEQMLEQPVPEDQPWAEVGLTLAAVYLVLHEEEEDGDLPSIWLPSWRRKRRSADAMLKMLEPEIRHFATSRFNERQHALMEQYRLRNPEARKRWVSRQDTRVRPTHRRADGQTVSIWEPFKVGEALLPYPGWIFGPDEEVFGCRCTLILVL